MIIGNRSSLAFEIHPRVPTWERRYLPERTAWAALSIWVSGINLCEHVDAGSDQLAGCVNVPLGALADWLFRSWPSIGFEERPALFAASEKPHVNLVRWGEAPPAEGVEEDEWFQHREAWWARHFVVAGTDDFFLPNLALTRDENSLILEWQPRRRPGGQPLWIRPGGARVVPWTDADEAVAEFVKYVAHWFREEGLPDVFEWTQMADPLRDRPADPQAALELYTGRTSQQLAALMGTGDAATLRQRLGLPRDSADPAASPLTQVLRDLPPGSPLGLVGPLTTLQGITDQRQASRVHLDALRESVRGASGPNASVEQVGYSVAQEVRRVVGMDGEPVRDVPRLLNEHGIETRVSEASLAGVQMLGGCRAGKGAAVILLQSPRTGAEWARRFEYARALGHFLLDPVRGDALGMASSPYCVGMRRRRAGAFAAELLLPLSALRTRTGGRLDSGAQASTFLGILRDFGIGASAAANHLWNHGLLSSPEVRDGLIEDHAAVAA